MKNPKRWLAVYAICLVIFLGIRTLLEYRTVNEALNSNEPKVLGVQTTRALTNPPILPPYPVLKQSAPKFSAYHYALYDADSGAFLVEQDADSAVPLASTTKIMTTTLAIEQNDLSTVHTVQKETTQVIGSTINLLSGEKITVKNLLYGALLNSGNDAAYALAAETGSKQYGSDQLDTSYQDAISAFVKEMNAKAKDLKLETLHFTDPSGLDNTDVGSARDLAILTAYALKNDTFRQIVGTAEASVTDTTGNLSHQLKNSNRLVSEWSYPDAIGVKTGFTPEAGHNLVGAIDYQGHVLIAVIINTYSSSNSASAEVARDILDFAKRSVEWR